MCLFDCLWGLLLVGGICCFGGCRVLLLVLFRKSYNVWFLFVYVVGGDIVFILFVSICCVLGCVIFGKGNDMWDWELYVNLWIGLIYLWGGLCFNELGCFCIMIYGSVCVFFGCVLKLFTIQSHDRLAL